MLLIRAGIRTLMASALWWLARRSARLAVRLEVPEDICWSGGGVTGLVCHTGWDQNLRRVGRGHEKSLASHLRV